MNQTDEDLECKLSLLSKVNTINQSSCYNFPFRLQNLNVLRNQDTYLILSQKPGLKIISIFMTQMMDILTTFPRGFSKLLN